MVLVSLLLACAVAQSSPPDDPPAPATTAAESSLRPDPAFDGLNALPGEVLSLWNNGGDKVFCTSDLPSYYELCKSALASDLKGIEDLAKAARATVLENGTQVRVIDVSRGFGKIPPSAEVRIQTGPLKDAKVFTLPLFLARLIPAGEAKAKVKERARPPGRQPADAPGSDPDLDADRERARLIDYLNDVLPAGARTKSSGPYVKMVPKPPASAAKLLQRGEDLEPSDPTLAALYYRAVIKGYPRTSQAARAKGHLKTLGNE